MNQKISILSVCIFIIIFSATFTQQAFAQASFSERTDFVAGTNPFYVVTGDINSDGISDAVVVNLGAASISVYINTTSAGASTPTFSAKTDFAVGNNPSGAAISDINGDGKQDVVVTNAGPSSVSVFINTTAIGASTPTLTRTDFSTISSPYSVAIGDLNGDGKPDMAVVINSLSRVSVFLNTTATGAATPAFSSSANFITAGSPTAVKLSDINSDGKLDLVVANPLAHSVSVFLNTTPTGDVTPSFSAKTDFVTDENVLDVSIGDINSDGKPDIVTGNNLPASMSVLLNTTAPGASTPTFSAKTNFTTPTRVNSLTVTDLNGDGKPDVTLASGVNASGFVTVYLNTTPTGASTPTFDTEVDLSTGVSATGCVITDVNRDFKPDIVTANRSGNSMSVFLNITPFGGAPLSLNAKTDFTIDGLSPANTVADFNLDGKPDIAYTVTSPGSVAVFLNTAAPGSSLPSFSKTDFAATPFAIGIANADFNGDGLPDIVCSGSLANVVSVLLNTTSPGASVPTFSAHADFASGSGTQGICTEDFNGDGLIDIACANSGAASISVFFNTTLPGASVPTFSARVDYPAGASSSRIISTDFNGDGLNDIAVSNRAGNSISLYFNTTAPGGVTPSFTQAGLLSTLAQPVMLCTADFNGDGKPDLAVTNSSGLSCSVFLNTASPGAASASFSARADFIVETNSFGVCAADFNGDGKPDLSVANFGFNTISILLNSTTPGATTPSFAAAENYAANSSPFGIAAGDFNLDGKQDFAFSNYSSANMSVYLNTTVLPLPVELASFTSSVNGNNVMLNWNTVSEENNSGFDIERNSFGAGWNKIGFIAGKGTVNTQQNYSFTDNGLNSGRYKYRLKQIDYNGNYKYYDLQNDVVVGVPSKFALMQNYPNPFNPVTRINYELPITNYVTLKIYDVTGKEVKQLVNEVQQAGYYAVDFNAASLSSGTYFYKLTSDKFSDVKKMVVVK